MSLLEAIANVTVGYVVAVLTQLLPLFVLETTLAENLWIGAIFTSVSLARS
jgi:hypothetical protein